MPALLDKRLIVVTGKGGVGKTTVAVALGLAAARAGKRTMLAEVAQQERVSRVFRREGLGYSEAELTDNLFGISVNPERALKESSRVIRISGGTWVFSRARVTTTTFPAPMAIPLQPRPRSHL